MHTGRLTGALRTNWALALIVVVGLSLRVATLFVLNGVDRSSSLANTYTATADGILAGDPFAPDHFEILHPWGYSFFVAGAKLLTGNSAAATSNLLLILQQLIDTAGIVLTFVAGRNLHSRRAGLGAAAFYAVNPLIIVAALQPFADSMSCFLMVAVVASASTIVTGNRRWPLWVGLSIGIAAQVRSEFILLSVVVLIFLLVTRRLRRTWRGVLAVFAIQAVITVPWVVGTWQATGTPLLTTANAGGSMYESLGQDRDNPWGITLGDDLLYADAQTHGWSSPWSVPANDYYRDKFMVAVKEHPGYFVELVVARRLPRVFNPSAGLPFYRLYASGKDAHQISVEYSDAVKNGTSKLDIARTNPRALMFAPQAVVAFRALMLVSFGAMALYAIGAVLRRNGRTLLVLLPLGYFVVSLTVLKQVEDRNLFTLLPLYALAFGGVISGLRRPTQHARPATDATSG